MSLGFWNICGCKSKNTLEKVKLFCNVNSLSIVMLCETKSVLLPLPSPACLRMTGFTYFECIPTQGLSCGIWLLWKDDVFNPFNLHILTIASCLIVCKLSLLNFENSLVILFIYASANPIEKFKFWDDVSKYVNSISDPFIIMGDFNELSSKEDKMGGAPFKYSRITHFNNILSSTNCLEIEFFE